MGSFNNLAQQRMCSFLYFTKSLHPSVQYTPFSPHMRRIKKETATRLCKSRHTGFGAGGGKGVGAGLGIRSFAHCSFTQIAQDKWATVSESLRSLRENERPWAIRSSRSEEISNVSKSLILLTKNQWISTSLKKFWLKKSKNLFYNVLFKDFFFKFEKWANP